MAHPRKFVAPDGWLYGKTEFDYPGECASDRNLVLPDLPTHVKSNDSTMEGEGLGAAGVWYTRWNIRQSL
jgi:hypothetical protein